jgi:CheY-like chemotaxis protein
VKVASAGKDQGATFTVSLPQGAKATEGQGPMVEPRVEARDQSWERLPALDDVTVLVVDDDPDAREVLGEMLRLRGAHVTVAASAAEALQAFTEVLPQVLISDIAMPDQDGLELIRRIRRLKSQGGGRTPALALTAHAGPNDSMAALAAGFDRYLAKPVDPKELVGVVAQLAGRIERRRQDKSEVT